MILKPGQNAAHRHFLPVEENHVAFSSNFENMQVTGGCQEKF